MRHISHYPGQHVHPLLAKTAGGGMSEADLTRDGEWGFWVEVADAVGGTIHPFDKYQGPYIRYNGNQFWLQSDETGDFVYNETTGELRPIFESVGGGLQFGFVPAAVAEEIRDMARTSSRKTAVNFDFGDLTTINPDTGRFRSVYPEGGNPKYRGYNILELLEDALDNAVSFMPTVSYREPTTVTVTCVESGWSASVDASKEGWGLRLLEQAEAHDDDYMGKWLDQNSDFSGYRASRKTAEMSSSKRRYWKDKGYNIGVKVIANGYDPLDGDIEPLDGQFSGDSIPDVFGGEDDVEDLGGTLEEAIEAYEEGWWEAVEEARWE